MKLTFEFAVLNMFFINLPCVQCDSIYSGQKISNDYRYVPLAYRNYSPIDDYRLPSTQPQFYHSGAPSRHHHGEEPRATVNTNFTFDEFIKAVNNLEHIYAKPGADLDHERRDSSASEHDVKYNHVGDEKFIPTIKSTTASPMENNGISVSFLKPDWNSITKPAITNMNSWSGLLQLILAFITNSKSGNIELKGFQDIIINGILKPILVAKGNIKSFVSKITIPLLSLLLINIEVLVTVWWLWEDCPTEMKIGSMNQSVNNHTNL